MVEQATLPIGGCCLARKPGEREFRLENGDSQVSERRSRAPLWGKGREIMLTKEKGRRGALKKDAYLEGRGNLEVTGEG